MARREIGRGVTRFSLAATRTSVRSAPARRPGADGKSNMTLTNQGTDPILHLKPARLAAGLAVVIASIGLMAPVADAAGKRRRSPRRSSARSRPRPDPWPRRSPPPLPRVPTARSPRCSAPGTTTRSTRSPAAATSRRRPTGWTLEGAASIAADSPPFLLGTELGVSSLELAAGATAVSPPICVARGFKSFRFAARSVSADQGALRVQVLYASGKKKSPRRVRPGAEWAPTRKLSLAQGLFHVRRARLDRDPAALHGLRGHRADRRRLRRPVPPALAENIRPVRSGSDGPRR